MVNSIATEETEIISARNFPHGGKLISRNRPRFDRALTLPQISITRRELCDLELIANGAYSPLEGFNTQEEFVSIVESVHLANGLAWSLPVTLSATAQEIAGYKDEYALAYEGKIVGVIEVENVFQYSHEREARFVYTTPDPAHPGVAATLARKNFLVGGKVWLLKSVVGCETDLAFTPAETRRIFAERGWKTIAAFQTRNPIHRAHEYLIKIALENVDGVLIHPLVGETKSDDIPADVRVKAYRALIDNYFVKSRVLLAALPASMRYAGPREAIHHAIIRKNYGATHFIVGRDHAGVGKYYGTYDAQKIFNNFTKEELDIEVLRFENSFFCKRCGNLSSLKTCPHAESDRLSVSGTAVRQTLAQGGTLPPEFSRPEVLEVLKNYYGGLK